jgi:hypothetical protein
MDFDLAFLLNIVGIFLAFGLLVRLYIWPGLRPLPQDRTLKILMLPHTFRFVGLSFLFYGVVSPELPSKAAVPAAWGDFAAAILALIAIAAVSRSWPLATLSVWLFNLWGSIDLLYAYYNGIVLHIKPGSFGAAYYIPTAIVPPLLVTHGLMFWVLIRSRSMESVSLRMQGGPGDQT